MRTLAATRATALTPWRPFGTLSEQALALLAMEC